MTAARIARFSRARCRSAGLGDLLFNALLGGKDLGDIPHAELLETRDVAVSRGIESTNYGALMAASGLACLPIFLIYVVLQRRVVNAFVRSGLR